MSTNYPTGLDSYTTRNPGDPIQSATIDALQDAVVALQTKAGITGSAVTSTLDYKTTTNVYLTGSGVPSGGTGANGNLYMDTATGIVYSKAAGSWSAVYTPAGGSSGATGIWTPTAQGLSAMTCDPSTANQGSNVTNVGTPYYTGIQLQAAATITKVYAYCSNSGTANHYACIYSAAGNLLVQSSLVAGSTAGNLVTWTVASTALSAGNYMVMLYSTSASGSITSFQRANSGSLPATILNVGMSSPFFRCATGSQTTLTTTAPSTTGTLTANNFGPMWIALGP